MKHRVWTIISMVLLLGLLVAGLLPAVAQEPAPTEAKPVLIRLRYATFDPLAGEPAMSDALRAEAYPEGTSGAYIVQFHGPIQEAWKEQVRALGGRVLDYIPDYAFLVWMDGVTQAQVAALGTVRWVGLYHPAYKLSPNLSGAMPIYRVILFPGVDLAAAQARLKDLNTPTTQVSGERFTLFLPDKNVEAVAAWPEVQWIEPRPFYKAENDVATGIMGGASAWGSGLNGSGMTATVADTGIDSGVDTAAAGDIHADFDNRMAHIASWPVPDDGCSGCCYANRFADDGADDVDSGHGTHVLGSVGGNGTRSSGQFKGLAYQASLTFQAVEQYVIWGTSCPYSDGYYLVGIPDDLNTLFQQAYDWGSRVHSNSWGSAVNGEYTSDSQAVDTFVWNHPGMTILFSAGNEGIDANADGYVDEDSTGSPGTAKNCITTGASDNERATGGLNPGGPCSTWNTCWPGDYPTNPTRDDRISDTRQELAAFSSRGPTNDGRIKPDVVAPGTNILSTRSQYISGSGWGWYDQWYMYMGGTSMSNPLNAGAATLVREYYVEKKGVAAPSAALVKGTLINSATDITGYGNASYEAGKPIPNNHEGWGQVNVGAATSSVCDFHDGDSVSTGGNRTYSYPVSSSGTPFKVTLAWSDYPGSLPSGGLVNNLNLVVTGPGGSPVYYGNHFSGGWSTPGGSAEAVNNVESVYVQSPAVGTWTVRVDGANVPQGPQPLAVVARGSCSNTPPADNWIYLPLVFKHFATGGGGVLWDQPLSAVNVNAYVNQQFPDATTYSSYLADDFVNPAAWNISTIFVPGDTWYSGGTPTNLFCATSLTWQIYADNAGIPAGNPQSGGAMWSLTLPPTDPQVSITTGSGGRLTDASLNLTAPIGLPAGHWWFVFYPTMSFGTCGQYGRQAADTANGYTGQFINPGGAFGYGSFWQAWTVLSPTQHDIAFRLEGN